MTSCNNLEKFLMTFSEFVRTKMIVRQHFEEILVNIHHFIGHFQLSILRFSTCSRLHTDLNWNIVKKLYKMQRFYQDFSDFQPKLLVFERVGRLYGLRVTNEWRRLRTATLYVDFILSLEIFTKISIQKVSHGHFWAMGFSYFI